MKVIWQTRAKIGRRQVAAYIRKEFGTKRAKKFKEEVDDTVKQLMRSPGIGQIDPLFEDRVATYRSVIINSLNKLVYRVDDDTIHIVAFWDTRREPTDEDKDMCKFKDTTLGIKKLDFNVKRGAMAAYLTDGREIIVPVSMFPDIKQLSRKQREEWMIMDDQYFSFETLSKIYSVKDLLRL